MIPYRRRLNEDKRTSFGSCRSEVVHGFLCGNRIAEEMDADIDPASLSCGRAVTAKLPKGTCLPTPSLKAGRGVLDSRKPSEQLFEAQRAVVYDAEAGAMRQW